MQIEQVPKTMEYICANIQKEELIFLLYDDHILHQKEINVTFGRFSSKVVRALSFNSIQEHVNDDRVSLIKVTP